MASRVGLGFDAHPFAPGRRLVLGTVEIDHPLGLAGHSDGDVLSHAVVDAILGAGGFADIGTHFPSDDPRWRDAESLQFLSEVVGLIRIAGHEIVNIDATAICEEPRLHPYRDRIQGALARALGVDIERVSVKATTTDGMGFTGRREGIAAVAVALLEEPGRA